MSNPKASNLSKAELAKLQVREYIERYHPDLCDAEIVVSDDGMFASVRNQPKSAPGNRNKAFNRRPGDLRPCGPADLATPLSSC